MGVVQYPEDAYTSFKFADLVAQLSRKPTLSRILENIKTSVGRAINLVKQTMAGNKETALATTRRREMVIWDPHHRHPAYYGRHSRALESLPLHHMSRRFSLPFLGNKNTTNSTTNSTTRSALAAQLKNMIIFKNPKFAFSMQNKSASLGFDLGVNVSFSSNEVLKKVCFLHVLYFLVYSAEGLCPHHTLTALDSRSAQNKGLILPHAAFPDSL